MNTSEMTAVLAAVEKEYGTVPVVLWDLDTGTYFSLIPNNFEVQRMGDGSLRLSVGLNDWEGVAENQPERRPLPFPVDTPVVGQ